MSSNINIVIAAEFSLAEKIADFLAQSELDIAQLTVAEIYPFNEEQGLRFKGKTVMQQSMDDIDWTCVNYLLFAGEVSHASHLAKVTEQGVVVIDVKGVCSILSDVPVVVPSVNEQQLINLRQRHIVSLPDPQTTQLALALADLADENVQQVIVTSLLPAAYISNETVGKLVGQTAQLLNGIPLDEDQQRLAFDVFPSHNGNLTLQLQKIFPQLNNVIFHQVQTPVFYGLAQMVTVLSDYELTANTLMENWKMHDFIEYHDTLITPVTNGEVENYEETVALHISQLSAVENGLSFWSVSDEQRFAQAFIAVKLLEAIYQQGY
ncbi:oxidoreductase [Conservatibacter flavescens]|uniref:Aspartate-semialdehyde dehydrogenase n=1 Tax=Conservatibacter flavescens TaxID=28161 RepID=A0A2M8S5T2_9PAST|nr:oxidoreductase [Conservatibacter flavescens]PJG86468.1 aspartate-semialdehyde dehydrogenase [Conservatibacter flavescens]